MGHADPSNVAKPRALDADTHRCRTSARSIDFTCAAPAA